MNDVSLSPVGLVAGARPEGGRRRKPAARGYGQVVVTAEQGLSTVAVPE